MKEKSPKQVEKEPMLKTISVIVITLVALVFLVARPLLDFDDNDNRQSAKEETSEKKISSTSESSEKRTSQKSPLEDQGQPTNQSDLQKSDNSDLQQDKNQNRVKNDPRPANKQRGPPSSQREFSGKLKKVGDDRLESESGLIFGPGSREGHRLDHVLRHAKDDLSKPVHGVFDGSQEEIIALIDLAYDRVKKSHRSVSESKNGKRTIYSIYFGKKIGYVGGKAGKQKKNPIAKTLVLVLEENNVITAYPK